MALDIEQPGALITYLREAGHLAADATAHVERLAGGVSNRTMLVTFDDGSGWVVKQALAKLRVKVDWFSDPARIHREAEGLRWLERLAPEGTITPLVFEDHEHHLLAMEAVEQPHVNWKDMLLAGDLRTDHVDQFASLLAHVHDKAARQCDDIAAAFDDRSFFESLRLEPYYTYTGEQVPEARAFYASLVADNRGRRLTLVHGDYSPKNVLVRDGKLILLDHEVIHFGDPAFDLGFAMTHLLSKAHHLAGQREAFAQAAVRFWQVYRAGVSEQPWAQDLEAFAVRNTLGCLLARVAGRSTLEYMDGDERSLQRRVVTALIAAPPPTVAALADAFCKGIADG